MFWLDVHLNYPMKSYFISIRSITWRSHREWAFTAWWNVWSIVSSQSGQLGRSAHRLVAMEVSGSLCMFTLNNLVLSIFQYAVAWQTGIKACWPVGGNMRLTQGVKRSWPPLNSLWSGRDWRTAWEQWPTPEELLAMWGSVYSKGQKLNQLYKCWPLLFLEEVCFV